jgi:hypothetical protein
MPQRWQTQLNYDPIAEYGVSYATLTCPTSDTVVRQVAGGKQVESEYAWLAGLCHGMMDSGNSTVFDDPSLIARGDQQSVHAAGGRTFAAVDLVDDPDKLVLADVNAITNGSGKGISNHAGGEQNGREHGGADPRRQPGAGGQQRRVGAAA